MELNLIRVFIAIYEQQSVTGAAETLFITQPSVSYALKKLRNELQDELFIRSGAGMRATQTADNFYKIFKISVNSIDNAVGERKTFEPRTSRSKFTVAVSNLGEYVFTPLIHAELSRLSPCSSLEIIQLNSSLLQQWLHEGRVDAAICNRTYEISEVSCDVLFADSYVCLARKGHPRAAGIKTPGEFLKERHITVSHQAGHHYIEQWINKHHGPLDIALRVPDFSAIERILSVSDNLCIVPSVIADMLEKEGPVEVYPTPFNLPKIEICLYTCTRENEPPHRKWFVELLGKTCRSYSIR